MNITLRGCTFSNWLVLLEILDIPKGRVGSSGGESVRPALLAALYILAKRKSLTGLASGELGFCMPLGPGTGEPGAVGQDAGGTETSEPEAVGPDADVSGTESLCRFIFFLISILLYTWGCADLVLFIGSILIIGELDGFVRFIGPILGVDGLALDVLL